jgi:hypothetical protein
MAWAESDDKAVRRPNGLVERLDRSAPEREVAAYGRRAQGERDALAQTLAARLDRRRAPRRRRDWVRGRLFDLRA